MKLQLSYEEFCAIMEQHYNETVLLLKSIDMSNELIDFAVQILCPGIGWWKGTKLVDLSKFGFSEHILKEAIQKYGDRKEH